MASARRRSAAALLAALCAAAPASGQAQGSAAPAEVPAPDAYKQHMTNGVKLFRDKNFPSAIAEFEAAFAAKPGPSPLQNVALCHKALFDYPKAVATLEKMLAEHGDSMSLDDRAASQEAIREMRALLALVTVEVTPATATLLVDGERRAAGAWKNPVALSPGTHRIGAEAEGYAHAEERITVASGESGKKVTIRLVANSGHVTVVAKDRGTAIAIDGKPAGSGEWKGRLTPGTHLVQFFTGGALVREAQILVTAGKEQRLQESNLPAAAAGGKGAEEKQEPPMRGLYGLVTAGTFFPTDNPGTSSREEGSAGDALSARSGGAAGIRLGYRFSNVVGLELMLEYRGLDKTVGTTPDPAKKPIGDYTYQSGRAGGVLRLMTPARRVRFVGSLGLGLSRDRVGIPAQEVGISGQEMGSPGQEIESSTQFFVLSETGIEFDFGGVLLGLTAQQIIGTEGASLGAGVRVGYGTW